MFVLSGRDRTTVRTVRHLHHFSRGWANLDALVLSPTEDGLKIRRVDDGKDVAHIFRGVNRVLTLEIIGGPNLVDFS